METIYCTLNAKRLTFLGAAGRKASGGETVCYAVAPRPRDVPRPSGKVISLDDYRAPGRPGARPAPPEEAPVPAERPPRPRGRRRPSLALTADLLASAAVVALLAAVAAQLAAL